MMLAEICNHIKNWFLVQAYADTYTISANTIELSFLQSNQYFRIVGSIFNDGIYKYPATNLIDEEFAGSIWALAIPNDFLAVVMDIETYQASNTAKPSNIVSESFGGYSYTKATNKSGNSSSWKDVFASRLNTWRKL